MQKATHTSLAASAKRNAKKVRAALANRPPLEELLTAEELGEATPFYFVLREFVAELKEARKKKGFTLQQLADETGLALETLSRLETGALVNPTWQTLTRYARCVATGLSLTLK